MNTSEIKDDENAGTQTGPVGFSGTAGGNMNNLHCPFCNPIPTCPHCGRPYQRYSYPMDLYVVWC